MSASKFSDAQRWLREALVKRLEDSANRMTALLSELPRGSLRYWTLTVAAKEDRADIFRQAEEVARTVRALGRLREAGRKSVLAAKQVLEEIREQDPQVAQLIEPDVAMAMQIAGYAPEREEPKLEPSPQPLPALPRPEPVSPVVARPTAGIVSICAARQRMPWEH